MEKSTAQSIISDWVAEQDEPFTSRDVFDSNDELENIGTVYAVMNSLFNCGEVARKKTDGAGFVFLHVNKATDDFERCKVNIGAGKKEHKAVKKQPEKQKQIVANHEPQENQQNKAVADQQQQFGQIAVPESFRITLKTPAGLVITITSEQISV